MIYPQSSEHIVIRNCSLSGSPDTEEEEASYLNLEDLREKARHGTPANLRRSAPWSWRLKRAWRAFKGRY